MTSLDEYLEKILTKIGELIKIAQSNTDLGYNIAQSLKRVDEELEQKVPWIDAVLPVKALSWKKQRLLSDWRLTKVAIVCIAGLIEELLSVKHELVRWKASVREFAVTCLSTIQANFKG